LSSVGVRNLSKHVVSKQQFNPAEVQIIKKWYKIIITVWFKEIYKKKIKKFTILVDNEKKVYLVGRKSRKQ